MIDKIMPTHMNIIENMEHPQVPKARKQMIDMLNNSKSALVITYDNQAVYHWFNLTNEQAISALELVKLSVLQDMK